MIDTSLAGASGVSPGGGGGGTVDQGAPGPDPWATYNDDISSVIGTSAPAADAKGFVVRVQGTQAMYVEPGVGAPGVEAQSFYMIQAGSGGPVPDEASVERLGVVLLKPIGAKTIADAIPISLATDHGPVAVTGTFFQATQPVSGPLTDAELRLSPVPVSGTFWQATQPVSGSVTADTELSAPAALADGTANPTVTSLGVFLQGYNGTTWDRVLTQNSRLVVSGNVANGAAAARPVTCGGVDTGGLSYPFVGAVVGSAIHQFVRASDSSGNGLALEITQTNGNARVKIEGSSPTADATTGVYTRFPTIGTASTAFASGVAQMKTSAGRVRTIEIFYTGATNSGLYVQLHAVNGTPTTATLVNSWPINAKSPRLTVPSEHDLPCPAGIALAFSTTETSYTAATTETGSAIVWGA